MAATSRERRSARAILLDEAGRVLLVRFVLSRSEGKYLFWATPGGGIEPGEDALTAARREVLEELGITPRLIGPIHEERGRFEDGGTVVHNIDTFFLGRCSASDPKLGWRTQDERDVLRELRWWSVEEIERSGVVIFPLSLPVLLRRCVVDAPDR